MKDKYLPIGTICSLKGTNKKIMITGFFSIEYNGNVTLFDYCGCDYPEGLLKNKIYSFNHDRIDKVYFVGYESNEHEILNNRLLDENKSDNFENLNSKDMLTNFKFDANGVVVFDGLANTINDSPVDTFEKKDSVLEEKDKYNFIKNQSSQPSHVVQNAADSRNWNIFKSIKFDDNGVVIEAEEYTLEEINEMKKNNNV